VGVGGKKSNGSVQRERMGLLMVVALQDYRSSKVRGLIRVRDTFLMRYAASQRVMLGCFWLAMTLAMVLFSAPSFAAPTGGAKAKPTEARIAILIAQTGAMARPSIAMVRALQMTAEKINQSGGLILGDRRLPVKLVLVDAQSDPAKAAAKFQALARDPSISAVIGPYDSDSVRALQTLAADLGLPLVNASGAALDENAKPGWVFSIGVAADRYYSQAIEAVVQRQTLDRPARFALAYEGNYFGAGIRAGVIAQLQSYGMALVFQHQISGGQDLLTLIKLLQKHHPTVLLFSANSVTFSRDVLRLIAQNRVNLDMVAMTGCQSAQITTLGDAADYTLCPVQWDGLAEQSDPYWLSSAAFLTAYDVAFAEEPPYQAAQAATALVVLAKAIEAAGALDRQKIHQALEDTDLPTLFGPVRFAATGRNMTATPLLEQVRGGNYMTVLPPERAWIPLVVTMPRWEDRLP
jgi:branched-chain amino acid transport system substrate-binding protein